MITEEIKKLKMQTFYKHSEKHSTEVQQTKQIIEKFKFAFARPFRQFS